jgi:hypothetical protein
VITESTDEAQIKLRFGYTLPDWIHAYRLHYSKTRRYWTDKILGGLLILASGFFLKGYYDPRSQQFVIGSGWDFFALLIFSMFAGIVFWFDLASLYGTWHGYRDRNKRGSTPKQYDFIFDDSGADYQLDTPESQVHVKVGWSEFIRIEEDKDMLLLITKDDAYWTVPKKYFPTSDDLIRFQHLVYSKIV